MPRPKKQTSVTLQQIKDQFVIAPASTPILHLLNALEGQVEQMIVDRKNPNALGIALADLVISALVIADYSGIDLEPYFKVEELP